jgi:putative oxidoreductase
MNSHELVVIGRSLIAVMFIASAVGKAANWKTTIGIMQIHSLPFPSLALSAALIIELAGAGCLLTGRFLAAAVVGLFVFLAVTTLTIPLQDAVKGKDRDGAFRLIGSNLAILGALLLLLAKS